MPELRDFVGSGGSSGLTRMKYLRAIIFGLLYLHPSSGTPQSTVAPQACRLEVAVYLDASGSTETLKYLDQFLAEIRPLLQPSGSAEVVVTLFSTTVDLYPCATFDPALSSGVPPSCQFTPDPNAKTNLRELFSKLREEADKSPSAGTRRLIVVLSDFVHSTRNARPLNLSDWTYHNEGFLQELAASLNRPANRRLLLIRTPVTKGNLVDSRELLDIASHLGRFFKLAEANDKLDLTTKIRSEILSDPNPLEVKVVRLSAENLEVEIVNPTCLSRTDVQYDLMPLTRRGKPILVQAANVTTPSGYCKSVIPETIGAPTSCTLPLPKTLASGGGQECSEYSLLVTPGVGRPPVPGSDGTGKAQSQPFTLYPCFKVQSVTLDVLPTDGRSSFPSKCYTPNVSAYEEEDIPVAGRNNNEVYFIGCIESRGLLLDGDGTFTFTEQLLRGPDRRTPRQPEVDGVNFSPKKVTLKRFWSQDRAPADSRYFPVFLALQREQARTLCYNAHDERPSRVEFGYSIVSGGQALTPEKEITLYRDRDREIEEALHNAWESLSVPLVVLLILVTLAVRGARRSSSAALEEYLGILGVCLVSIAAILHDVTNLGDDMEQKFSQAPGQYTGWGLVVLGLFFLYWVFRGAFEPRRGKSAASIEYNNKSLAARKLLFCIRTGIWVILVLLIVGWTGFRVRTDPKDLEECHFEGHAESDGRALP